MLHLKHLEDLDKLEISPAEKMTYQGILKPSKRNNIDEMLIRQMTERDITHKGEKVKAEVRQEILREKGMDNKKILEESLNEFKEMQKMDDFNEMMGEMMAR